MEKRYRSVSWATFCLFRFGVAIIVPEIMAGFQIKPSFFENLTFDDLCSLLTSIFTWAKKWQQWLRTGSLRTLDRRIAQLSSFPSFRVRGGSFCPPPWRRWLRPPPGRGLKERDYPTLFKVVFHTEVVFEKIQHLLLVILVSFVLKILHDLQEINA